MKTERIYYFSPEPGADFPGVYIDLDALIGVYSCEQNLKAILYFQLRAEPIEISRHYEVESFRSEFAKLIGAWKAYQMAAQ